LWSCCRLDLSSELALAVDRAADQRVTFIKQRWGAGPYRGPAGARGGSMQGALAAAGAAALLQCQSSCLLRSVYTIRLRIFHCVPCRMLILASTTASFSSPARWLSLAGVRQLSTVAPLSAKDTLELQDAYREALALVEAASLGLGAAGGASRASSALAVAAALNGRQERALKWAQGALAKAIEAREASIRCAGGWS
jgi:hypothetical protein